MTPGVVVDTDVFSFVYKGDTRAAAYAKHLTGRPLYLSFVTVAELYRWAVSRGWGRQRVDDLRGAIGLYRVVGCDDATAWHWAEVMCVKGRPVGPGDAWVAAVALRLGMPLVTNNRKHFEAVPGLVLLSTP